MKKIIQMLLIACLVVLGTQVAFANADKVTVQEGADLTAVHRLAIGSPLYMQVDPKSPNKDMLTQIVYESSRVARCYVISYDTIAQNIKADQNIDLKALDRRTAAKDFKQYVGNYADAYVILTVANDSRTTFFFDVYKAGTNELLYTYQIQANRNEQQKEIMHEKKTRHTIDESMPCLFCIWIAVRCPVSGRGRAA